MINRQVINQEKMSRKISMKSLKIILLGGVVGLLLLMLSGCATTAPQKAEAAAANTVAVTGAPQEVAADIQLPPAAPAAKDKALPVRFQNPSYIVKDVSLGDDSKGGDAIAITVGADITSSTGPVALRDIMKRIAGLKGMNVSWASDVEQQALVDVDIRADDDFFHAIDNLLRQLDYYHEVEGNTIVVKYKQTRKFHLAMPPRIAGSSTSNAVGGSSTNVDTATSRWDGVRASLDKVLSTWAGTATIKVANDAAADEKSAENSGEADKLAAAIVEKTRDNTGNYFINEELGLIIFTAPKPLLEKVETYVENLKTELYRQISIEAKIIEVTLSDKEKSGIDWSELFSSSSFNFNVDFGDDANATTGTPENMIYPRGSFLNRITLDAKSVNLVMDAIKGYGETKVLSNPKVSVMNGQPAVIYVGDNVTYISTVTTTVGDSGAVSTSVATASASSGLRLEVFPTIINDDEIILSLIPTISGLTLPIEYRTFGTSQVGLPEIKERTMNSIVRIKNGELLIVGGLIDSVDDDQNTKVPLLGDAPLINKLFKKKEKENTRRELIVLLKPTIL